jgi:hypothetical protein
MRRRGTRAGQHHREERQPEIVLDIEPERQRPIVIRSFPRNSINKIEGGAAKPFESPRRGLGPARARG